MKQYCKCGKTFKNIEQRMECPNCEIERYNQGRKARRKKTMPEEETTEAPEETTEESTEESTEEATE